MSAAPKYGHDVGGAAGRVELEGWAGLEADALDEITRRALQADVDHASMYRRAFSSHEGAYVLRDMMGVHMLGPVVTAESTQFQAGIRQGEANAVRRILALIEFANTGGKLTGTGAGED